MKLSEIQIGKIFTIGETPTYPKFRTETGWVDMRDIIIVNRENIPYDCRIMEREEMSLIFKEDIKEIDNWIKEFEKYKLAGGNP